METVLIIGGTRGIGRALAVRCLERGMNVTVCGRDSSAMYDPPIADHPKLRVAALDIADASAVRTAVAQASKTEGTLDLLIVTAGLYFNTRAHHLDESATLQLLRTNVSGLAVAFEAAAEQMLAQGCGRMAAISSMAGLLNDYSQASVYSATKRSVLNLCDTYRKALLPFGIHVTAIVPGYVNTARLRELNHGDASHKLFLMSEDEAADRILRAIDEGEGICAFPWQMRIIIRLLNMVPRLVRVLCLSLFNRKSHIPRI